jgi:hypothetical protein
VIYRSKMHLGLKRNLQVMPGAQWLELLCKHTPDRYEQLVRYCGWYSSRSRGVRKAKGATAVATTASGVIEVLGEYASRAKAAWARLPTITAFETKNSIVSATWETPQYRGVFEYIRYEGRIYEFRYICDSIWFTNGTITVTFAPDFRSFDGNYTTGSYSGKWNGRKPN